MIRYKAKKQVIMDLSMSSPFKKKEVFIVKENIANGVWIPSQLSEFLRVSCNNDSPHTKYSKALTICNFINFLLDETKKNENVAFNILKEEGFYGLKLIHASKYLNYLSKDGKNNFETMKKKESIIIDLYYFLQNKKVISGKDATIETKLMIKKNTDGKESNKAERVKISPFHDKGSILYVSFPPKKPTAESGYKKRKPKLEDMEIPIFSLFLEYVWKETRDIALPVYIQCMGGLRCGEVMNLTLEDLTIDRKNKRLFLNIQDRQIELFGRKTSLDSEIKYERENQVVFDFNGKLLDVVDYHLSYLSKNAKVKCTSKGNTPLFFNHYGKPMTGEVYRNKFNNLRDKFIAFASEHCPQSLVEDLETHEWSTHIGRHLFTNYLIKMGLCDNSLGEPDSKILATLRGDLNVNSALSYISKRSLAQAVDKNIKSLSKLAINFNYKLKIDFEELLPKMSAYQNLNK